jgi:hypothetical protein
MDDFRAGAAEAYDCLRNFRNKEFSGVTEVDWTKGVLLFEAVSRAGFKLKDGLSE